MNGWIEIGNKIIREPQLRGVFLDADRWPGPGIDDRVIRNETLRRLDFDPILAALVNQITDNAVVSASSLFRPSTDLYAAVSASVADVVLDQGVIGVVADHNVRTAMVVIADVAPSDMIVTRSDVDGILMCQTDDAIFHDIMVERIRRLAKDPTYRDEVPQARRLGSLPLDEVLEATARLFDVDQAAFAQTRSALVARDIAAWMARRLTCATLGELAAPFGLTHPDSVANLTRRAERAMQQRRAFVGKSNRCARRSSVPTNQRDLGH